MKRVTINSRDLYSSSTSTESSSSSSSSSSPSPKKTEAEVPPTASAIGGDYRDYREFKKKNEMANKPSYPTHHSFVVDLNNRPLYQCDPKPMTPRKVRAASPSARRDSPAAASASTSARATPPIQQMQHQHHGQQQVSSPPPSVQSKSTSPTKDPLAHLPPSQDAAFFPGEKRRGGHRLRKQRQRVPKALCTNKARIAFVATFLLVALVLYAALLGQTVETRDVLWDVQKTLRQIHRQINQTKAAEVGDNDE